VRDIAVIYNCFRVQNVITVDVEGTIDFEEGSRGP